MKHSSKPTPALFPSPAKVRLPVPCCPRLMPVLALPAVALVAFAAPVPKVAVVPISAMNAAQVRVLDEVDRRADRITRGPGKGELTVLDRTAGVEVLDENTLRPLRKPVKDAHPITLATSPDGKLVAWTERNKTTYTVLRTDTDKSFDIELKDDPDHAAFSPDSKLLAIGSTFWDPRAEGAGHTEVRLFDATGKLLRTLARSGAGSAKPVFSPDGKTLAVSNRNYESRLFDVATGKLLHVLDKKMTQEVAFSPDGKVLATAHVDGTLARWDTATGKELRSAASGCKELYSVDWSPKGDVLVTSGRQGPIVVWEPGRLAKLKELDAPAWVIQVRFVSDSTRFITSSALDLSAKSGRKFTIWGLPNNK